MSGIRSCGEMLVCDDFQAVPNQQDGAEPFPMKEPGTKRTGERALFSREENFRRTWHDFVPDRNCHTGSGARLA